MITEELLLLFTKTVTGQATEDESKLLNDWLHESRENSELFHSYKEAYLNGKYKLKARNKDEVYNKLTTKLQFQNNHIETNNDNKLSKPVQHSVWMKMAAAILILFTSFAILYRNSSFWLSEKQKAAIPHELIVKSNPSGVKSLITLPDGSKVKLNSESHLEYYSDFEQERSVKLIGEAFFEVVEDTLRPFYVSAGDLRVRVLGTSFNIAAFPFEKSINVALVSGEVLLEKKEGLQMKLMEYLKPDEMLIYDHQAAEFTVTGFEKECVIGWKDGKLHFDETDLYEVMEKLERWYGVEIIVSPTADLSGRFTNTYINDPLPVVLDGISFTSDLDCKIEGKKVYIN